MAEATIGALSNLAIATAADRGVVAALTHASSRLAKQLEDNSNELRELKAFLKKERSDHPEVSVGRVVTKFVALTRVSLVNSQNSSTKRRPLEPITWEVVRPTGNDIQGQQL
jgi:hypothetical protein